MDVLMTRRLSSVFALTRAASTIKPPVPLSQAVKYIDLIPRLSKATSHSYSRYYSYL